MKFGEQLAIPNEELWGLEDPIERVMVNVPGAVEYLGTDLWTDWKRQTTDYLDQHPESQKYSPVIIGALVFKNIRDIQELEFTSGIRNYLPIIV